MHYPLAFLPLTACLPRKGAGSIASPLMTALEREPDAILGKPAQNMLQSILAEYVPVIHEIDCWLPQTNVVTTRYNLDPKKTCMIGDRLDTDIDFGNRGGLTTLCVLTGVTSESKLLSDSNPIKATYYIDSFGDFAPLAN
jgi:4-nitrophenyl phosphatase